jgi:hypothetical protein
VEQDLLVGHALGQHAPAVGDPLLPVEEAPAVITGRLAALSELGSKPAGPLMLNGEPSSFSRPGQTQDPCTST